MSAELGRRGTAGSRTRFDHFTTVEGAISYCSAIALQLSPGTIAAATRCLKAFEYGLAMHTGPPSQQKGALHQEG
jgi:hypothetical protein